MHTSKRSLAVLIGVLLLSSAGLPSSAQVIEEILVKVNGEIFTKTDLETRQVSMLRQLGTKLDPVSDPTGAELRRALEEITPRLMVDVIDEMLLVQRGRELGYRMNDEQFEGVLENLKKENGIDSDEELQAALKEENMTMSDLRQHLERTIIISRVQQNEVIGRIAVSEDEARRYYDAHLAEFTKPATVTLREIFIATSGEGAAVPPAEDQAAREEAEGVRTRALSGESFETMASELSDAPSRANGGLIGPFSLDDITPELRTRLEGMKVGEVTDVLRAPRGYQILKLEDSSPAETVPFEDARQEISDRVFTDRRRSEFQRVVETLRSQAIIEWRNEELKKAFELGLQQSKGAIGVGD